MTTNLTHSDRITLLRHCAGRLQADTDPATRWLGQQLSAALATGQGLDAALGFRPSRGSRATASAIIRREALDRDVACLVQRYGVSGASLVLAGAAPTDPDMLDVVARLKAAGVGASPSAISRAMRRARHKP